MYFIACFQNMNIYRLDIHVYQYHRQNDFSGKTMFDFGPNWVISEGPGENPTHTFKVLTCQEVYLGLSQQADLR